MTNPCTVTIEGHAQGFTCADGSYVLDAALANGVQLPYNCRGGACGTCKAQVLEGAVVHGWVMGFAITDEEIREGKCLICCSRPKSDRLSLRMLKRLPSEGATFTPAEYSAEVLAVSRISPSVCHITVHPGTTELFRFESGMYVEVVLEGLSPPRPYSIATPALRDGTAPDGMIDLLVARHENGRASVRLHETTGVTDKLLIRGPYGTFRLPPTVQGSILMLAGGTGLAPLISMAGSLLARRYPSEIELWLGTRTSRDVIWLDELRRLTSRHANFRFRVFLSRAHDGDLPHDWARGHVTEYLASSLNRSRFSRMLAAGSPAFVDACRRSALQAGMGTDSIQFEAYDNRVAVP